MNWARWLSLAAFGALALLYWLRLRPDFADLPNETKAVFVVQVAVGTAGAVFVNTASSVPTLLGMAAGAMAIILVVTRGRPVLMLPSAVRHRDDIEVEQATEEDGLARQMQSRFLAVALIIVGVGAVIIIVTGPS